MVRVQLAVPLAPTHPPPSMLTCTETSAFDPAAEPLTTIVPCDVAPAAGDPIDTVGGALVCALAAIAGVGANPMVAAPISPAMIALSDRDRGLCLMLRPLSIRAEDGEQARRTVPTCPTGNPADWRTLLPSQPRGFASPPHSGFAFVVT